HGRNVHLVLGVQCTEPVDMLVCWTPDDAIEFEDTDPETGGTGMAIRVARQWRGPGRNLQRADPRAAAAQDLTSWSPTSRGCEGASVSSVDWVFPMFETVSGVDETFRR